MISKFLKKYCFRNELSHKDNFLTQTNSLQSKTQHDIEFYITKVEKFMYLFHFFLKNNFKLENVETRVLNGEKSDVSVLSLKLSG